MLLKQKNVIIPVFRFYIINRISKYIALISLIIACFLNAHRYEPICAVPLKTTLVVSTKPTVHAGPVTNNEDYFGGNMTELSEEKMYEVEYLTTTNRTEGSM